MKRCRELTLTSDNMLQKDGFSTESRDLFRPIAKKKFWYQVPDKTRSRELAEVQVP